MRKFLADIQLRAIIKRFATSKNKQFLSWSNIQKVALVLNADQNINKSVIDKFVAKHQKYMEVFYVEVQSKAATYADWQCITKNDLNILQLPKSALLTNFHQKQFDLVINTCDENDLVSQSIGSALIANYKCASFEKLSAANLVIKRAAESKLNDYLEEIVKYLKMIKN